MGAAIGACFQSAGHTVFWLPEGRSAASIERAKRAALRACDTLDQLLSEVHLVISICPPDAADRVIDSVIAANYSGRFMDANAVSPQRLLAMQERSQATKMTLVDGSIIGLPIWPEARRRQTTLHLSGPETAALAEALQGSPLKVNHVSDRLGDASALKMTFAAFSKGSADVVAAALYDEGFKAVADLRGSAPALPLLPCFSCRPSRQSACASIVALFQQSHQRGNCMVSELCCECHACAARHY